ncbi:hypothetical protein LEP1GSC042_0570 [Leptospira kirschneri serovar Bim str. PUO 1247]|nr:hypothetical protein LEP1GSC042_0570 [Leptospira kirschneri serovar Bim str. PUO 1247]
MVRIINPGCENTLTWRSTVISSMCSRIAFLLLPSSRTPLPSTQRFIGDLTSSLLAFLNASMIFFLSFACDFDAIDWSHPNLKNTGIFRDFDIWIAPCSKQGLNHIQIAVVARIMQEGHSVFIGRRHICALPERAANARSGFCFDRLPGRAQLPPLGASFRAHRVFHLQL